MIPFLDLYAFFSVVLRALTLAFEALMIGGVIFRIAITREVLDHKFGKSLSTLIASFAAGLAMAQAAYVAANSAVLMASTTLTWAEISGASFVIWGIAVAAGAALTGIFAKTRWAKLACPAGCALVVWGAVMTSHSAARMENRPILVALTAVHHLASAAWIGGMLYLLIGVRRTSGDVRAAMLRRFSAMAMISVAALVSAGLVMSRLYVGSVAALAGTSYGVMLMAKVLLTAVLLGLGALNFRIVRAIRAGAPPHLLPLSRLAEAELGIGVTVILAAASLTSSPPAIDVQTERVSGAEIAARMIPKWPRMRTPSFSELSPATPLHPASLLSGSFVPGQRRTVDTPADIAWSEYNHHWAGLIVLAAGILSLFARRRRWARAWPLVFFGLAVFLLIRADSENWPLGPRGFWESFQVAEVALHRVFVLLIVIFAAFEWRVQSSAAASRTAAVVFPLVCAAGGALLLTHSHSLGNVKEEFLAELSHLPLAVLAVTAGWSRWLEVRLAPAPAPLRWLWPVCFTLIGVILLNYREA